MKHFHSCVWLHFRRCKKNVLNVNFSRLFFPEHIYHYGKSQGSFILDGLSVHVVSRAIQRTFAYVIVNHFLICTVQDNLFGYISPVGNRFLWHFALCHFQGKWSLATAKTQTFQVRYIEFLVVSPVSQHALMDLHLIYKILDFSKPDSVRCLPLFLQQLFSLPWSCVSSYYNSLYTYMLLLFSSIPVID